MWNAVARGDLRARRQSSKSVGLVTFSLALLAATILLLVPQELEGDSRIHLDAPYLLLAIQMALFSYLISASACGEIAIEGEKTIWDLAGTRFPPRVIVYGKMTSSLLSCLTLLVMAAPFQALVVGLTGASPALLFVGWLLTLAIAWTGAAVALWGMTLRESEALRSLVHWAWLGTVLLLSAVFPAPWRLLNPFRALRDAFDGGWAWIGSLGSYMVLSLVFLEWARWRLQRWRRLDEHLREG
ncbi:MAG: hypothetical protein QN189_01390 [Armatimonadota bacterium]|nr:hypothetical protein [Armatimonadota bacterium]